MKKLKVLLSLTNNDNDYQIEQAKAAESAAARLGIDLQVIYADNDSIKQSQQLLNVIQSRTETHPDAIILEPAGGTALPQVARAAAAAEIGWVVLNRDVDYITELRKAFRVPIFSVSSNHEEIGRLQGQQIGALLPNGGSVLYIQGPAENSAAKQRSAGMYETKPVDVAIKVMRGAWTEESAYRAVQSWLRLSTSQQSRIDAVVAQDDSMAIGARKAFQELPNGSTRDRWLRLPFTGCDGLPRTGQAWVRNGMLAATIIDPPNSGQAIEMLVKAVQAGVAPSDRTLTTPVSFPEVRSIVPIKAEQARGTSA